jgi:hypothetical protein
MEGIRNFYFISNKRSSNSSFFSEPVIEKSEPSLYPNSQADESLIRKSARIQRRRKPKDSNTSLLYLDNKMWNENEKGLLSKAIRKYGSRDTEGISSKIPFRSENEVIEFMNKERRKQV